ncbi:hypothetical protein CAEBREN_20402 [Caenorhabditis brenneri]|uniref:Uncharacterized protein n=1 Tax=Caenorhabditis brenneri TaxID=135651 RepID=G0MXQ3_CAEBE|nr:hypothetical protein CAEBREN_20402 [Caenorhabditis brenneri]
MRNIDLNSDVDIAEITSEQTTPTEEMTENGKISGSISSSSFEEVNVESEESLEKKELFSQSEETTTDRTSEVKVVEKTIKSEGSVQEVVHSKHHKEEQSEVEVKSSSQSVTSTDNQELEKSVSSENINESLRRESTNISEVQEPSIVVGEVEHSEEVKTKVEITETPLVQKQQQPQEAPNSKEESKTEDIVPKMREEPIAAPRPIRRLSVARASMMAPKPSPRLAKYMEPVREEGQKKKKPRSMFSWLGGDSSKKKNKEVLETVSEGLRKIYKQKLLPLEEYHKYHDFHSPALDDPDFDAKPMILLVGQYSTGKTTFIRYLLESDFPGIRIGPEPTTDRFIAVMHGDEEGSIPGNALVVDAKKQFRALSGFGNAFLNRFQCSTLPNQVLESVTIVDTPGILSGEKQRIDRGYDFTGVLEWFAERVDRIILLFDAHKLDISDEFKRCIEALAGNEDKIRIVLNKSDMVDHQQLMRVYGALMWSLGKVFKTPEVSRVYLGSFWDHPLHYDINRRLFQDEQHDLFQDLQALPRNAALRKLNDLIKRARLAKVHAYIIAELRKQMPSMIGKEKKKKELIQNLDKIYEQLQREHNISPGDFPDVNKMREKLQAQDFSKFNPLKPKLLEVVDGMLATDIARLMAQIPKEEASAPAGTNGSSDPTVKGGAFSQTTEAETPFGFGRGEGFDKGADEAEWVVNRERTSADSTFESLGPVNGFLSGRAAKEHMVKSKLPNSVLGKVWKLADIDKDGQLDADEFALANYLINLKLEGHEIPAELPKHLIPPSKRGVQEPVYPTLNDNDE